MDTQNLFDALSGAAGHPINRAGLNMQVDTAQQLNGLRSAQTEEALMKAQQAREQEQSATDFKTAYVKAGHSETEADLADSVVRGGLGKDFASYTEGANRILDADLMRVISDPNGDPNKRLAAIDALSKKANSPYTNAEGQLVNNMAPNAATGPPQVFQTPVSEATVNEKNASASLHTQQAEHPEKFHQGAAASDVDQNTIDLMGDRFFETGQLPATGMGAAGAALRTKIMQSATARATGQRQALQGAGGQGAAASITGNAATVKAGGATLTDMTKRTSIADSSEQTANTNLQLAEQYMTKADETGAPVINSILNKIRAGALGDPDVSAYTNALTTAANEYARVVSMATGAQGITDAARAEGHKMFNTDLAPDQLKSNIQVARKEMSNRTGSLHDQIAQAKRGLYGGPQAPPTAGAPAAPPGGSPAGAAPGGVLSLDAYLKSKGF